MSYSSSFTLDWVFAGPGDTCATCKRAFQIEDACRDGVFALPCSCIHDRNCLTTGLQMQLALGVSCFTCPACSTIIKGPDVRELLFPDGKAEQVQPGETEGSLIAVFEDCFGEVTGRVIYQEELDPEDGFITISVSVVREMVLAVRNR